MIEFARKGRGQCEPLVLHPHKMKRDFLSDEQREAVRHVLESPDRVIAVRGGAGVGKTTSIMEAVEAIEGEGRGVFTFAPSADASRGTLREEGFENADTVARLLKDEKLQDFVSGNVIWVDEAGQLGTRTMNQLFRVAKQRNARVVLSGDVHQHGSVDRGDALRVLESHAGIRPAEITKIRRQRGEYREAISKISKGRSTEGFDRLDSMGRVHEVNDDERYNRLAADYFVAVEAKQSTLVVSPTHREGQEVTDLIRAGKRERGTLRGAERALEKLRPLSLTDAEKQDSKNFETGHVIQFNQNVKGFKNGFRTSVELVDKAGIWVRNSKGDRQMLDLAKSDRFAVYKTEQIAVAAGERIRITRNGKTAGKQHALNNGSLHTVRGFAESGDLVTSKGWLIPKDYGYLTYGYVTTSHASQGKTVDRVFLAQSSKSFGASSREQFYVSASRGRQQVDIYTDNKAELRAAIRRTSERLSASELTQRAGGTHQPQLRLDRLKQHAARLRRQAKQIQRFAARTTIAVQERFENWRERLQRGDAGASRTYPSDSVEPNTR
ncbi:MAG: AAA family ATPase [Planctomycetota bacterium]